MNKDRAAEFDAEAVRPREGWELQPKKPGGESWVRRYPGGYVGSVYVWDDGEVTFAVEDQNGSSVGGGRSSRRGWAMDGADSAAKSNLN